MIYLHERDPDFTIAVSSLLIQPIYEIEPVRELAVRVRV